MSDPSFQRVVASLQRATNNIKSADAVVVRCANLLLSISSNSRGSALQTCKEMDRSIDKGMSTIKSTKKKDLKDVQDQLLLAERFVKLHGNEGGHGSYRMQATRISDEAKEAVEGFEAACASFSAAVSKAEKRRKVMLVEEEGDEETRRRKAASESKEANQKSKQKAAAHSASQRTVSSTEGDFDEEGIEGKPLLKVENAKEKFERELHAELMRDREREVKELCENINDINEIFGHINELVGEQGDKLEHGIAIGIEDAERRTRQGAEALEQARQHNTSAQRRQLCMLISAVVLVLTVALVVVATN